MTFNELNLSAPLLRAIAEAGYETPSPIQAKAIPPVLERPLLSRCPCWTASMPPSPASRVPSGR